MRKLHLSALIFLAFIIYFKFNNGSEIQSEFVITQEKKAKKTLQPSKLRESILDNFRKILELDLNFNKFSINLREFALSEIDDYLAGEDSFIRKAKLNELEDSLSELNDLKEKLEKNINEFKKKLVRVKSKFVFNQKNNKGL